MLESVTIKDIDEKLIEQNVPNAAKHYFEIVRKAKYPEIEEQYDKDLTPKALHDKYTRTFHPDTEDLLNRIDKLLKQLGNKQKGKMLINYGVNNTLLVYESDSIDVHDEFNRIEMVQVKDIITWCYSI